MTHQRTTDPRPVQGELTEAQLANVSGGEKVVAPRDSVSGNATGRRAYKPVV